VRLSWRCWRVPTLRLTVRKTD